MRRPDRLSFVMAGIVVFAGLILARAARVQLLEHAKWQADARQQQYSRAVLLAKRGTIFDRAEEPLAESQELVSVGFSPREVPRRERARVLNELKKTRQLRISAAQWKEIRDTSDKWVQFGGVFYRRELAALGRLPGIRFTAANRRQLTVPVSLIPLVGRVDRMGRATDGLELAFDSLLQGVEGRGLLVKDRGEQPFSPFSSIVAPTPGHDVVLTINRALQEVVERELVAGVRRHRASGGDVLVMDARSGAVLAAVGVRDGKVVPSATPLTEPYEPGSVIKPFVVARLLDEGKTTPATVLNTENGKWTLDGRTFEDSHRAAQMSVADIIRFSSNIGIVKLVRSGMRPGDEYALLRDLGLGAPTGVPYLGESAGRLPTVDRWTKWTWAQVATGYEVMATPLQLAQAYTSLANDGQLIEPALVAEIRNPERQTVWQHRPRVLRRVMTPATTQAIRGMLESVVDSGTATAAGLTTYGVAGKSGTARRAIGRQGYVAGRYNSSFIALFPADAPQLVLVSRMIDPTVPSNFGGATAGSVVREVLTRTLSLPDVLDRTTLRESPRARLPLPRIAERDNAPKDSTGANAIADTVPPRPRPTLPTPPMPGTFVLQWPAPRNTRADRPAAAPTTVAVPDVRGLSLRDATRALHAAGLHVALGGARESGTTPAAGALVRVGSTVQLGARP